MELMLWEIILMSLEAESAVHLWCLVFYLSSCIDLGGGGWIDRDGRVL